jgi:hypothetical protein
MVPLCSNHSLIVRFIEGKIFNKIKMKILERFFFIDRLQYKYGLINHALAGALREIVQVRFYEQKFLEFFSYLNLAILCLRKST